MSIVAKSGPPYSPLRGTFSPASIPGLSFWMDALDTSSFTLGTDSSGQYVTSILDKSPSNLPSTITGSLRYNPVFPGFGFGIYSNNTYIDVSINSSTIPVPESLFVVMSTPTGVGTNPILGTNAGGSASGTRLFTCDASALSVQAWGQAGTGSFAANSNDMFTMFGRKHLLGFINLPGCIRMFINGNNVGISSNTIAGFPQTAQPCRIGFIQIYYYTGHIYELLWYKTALQDSDRYMLEDYLMKKWSLPLQPTFSPTDISGCRLWLDGSDSYTVNISGGKITQWSDKSGSNKHAVQTTVSNQPTYSSSAGGITFTGTQSLVISNLPLAMDTCQFTLLLTHTSVGTGGAYMFHNSPTPNGFGLLTGNQYLIVRNTGAAAGGTIPYFRYIPRAGTNLVALSCLNVSGGYIQGYTQNTTDVLMRLGASTLPALPSSSNLVIGGYFSPGSTGGFNGDFNEMIIYDRILSSNEYARVRGYLFNKWRVLNDRYALQLSPRAPYYRPIAPPAVRPFSPRDLISNICTFWLDAADRTSFTLTGSNVASIVDKSPAVSTLNVSGTVVYSSNIGNGTPGFDMTNGMFLSTLANALPVYSNTTYIVTSLNSYPTSNGDPAIAYSSGTVQYTHPLDISGSALRVFHRHAANWDASMDRPSLSTPFLWTSQYSLSNLYAWCNGGQSYVNRMGVIPTTSNGTEMWIGCDRLRANRPTWPGYICEILSYNVAHNVNHRELIEGYLATKWKLRSNLPSSHGYKIAPVISTGGFMNPLMLQQSASFPSTTSFNNTLVMWFDAALTSTITVSGSSVTRWNDRSGWATVGYAMSNVGLGVLSGLDTLNGLNMIRFPDGSGNFLQSTTTMAGSSGQQATFLVAKMFPTQTQRYSEFYASNNFRWQYDSSALEIGNRTYTATPGAMGVIYPGNLADTAFILTHYRIANSFTVRLNGSNYTPTASNIAGYPSPATATMGGQGGSFYLGEFMQYSHNTITVHQSRAVEGYLAWKWGLQKSLPSNHPYRYFSPY
jgi:hypothetical protein